MTAKGAAKSGNCSAKWVAEVKKLVDQVADWAVERKWEIDRSDKLIRESKIGTYSVPYLKIKLPAGILHLDPVAREVIGADGRVDLYSWPTLNRVSILRIGRKWIVRTDSGVDWPESWNRRTFFKLAESLK